MNKLEKYIGKIMKDGGSTAVGMIGNKVVEIAHKGNLEINAIDDKRINSLNIKDSAVVEELDALIPALQDILETSGDEDEIKASKLLLNLLGIEVEENTANEELNSSKDSYDGVFEKDNLHHSDTTEFDDCIEGRSTNVEINKTTKESIEYDCFA